MCRTHLARIMTFTLYFVQIQQHSTAGSHIAHLQVVFLSISSSSLPLFLSQEPQPLTKSELVNHDGKWTQLNANVNACLLNLSCLLTCIAACLCPQHFAQVDSRVLVSL